MQNDGGIDEESRSSRYPEILAELRRELSTGRYSIGDRFPGEPELQDRFGVGRHTVRVALQALTDEGLIERRRRLGTFVRATEPVSRYVQTLGSLRNLLDFGADTALHIHTFGHITPRDPIVFEWLKIPAKARWLHIVGTRVHRKSLTPVCWSEFFLSPRYPLSLADVERLNGPIHEFVANRYSFQVEYVEQEIGATGVPTAVSEMLEAPVGSPALAIVRRYHRSAETLEGDERDTLTQATLNIFPQGRYMVVSRIDRER